MGTPDSAQKPTSAAEHRRVRGMRPQHLRAAAARLSLRPVCPPAKSTSAELSEWAAARPPSAADKGRPCVKRRKLRSFSLRCGETCGSRHRLGGQSRYCQLHTCPSSPGLGYYLQLGSVCRGCLWPLGEALELSWPVGLGCRPAWLIVSFPFMPPEGNPSVR